MNDLLVASTRISSREIAKQAEKEHKQVMRDIRVMLEQLGQGTDLYLAQYESNNRYYDEYLIPKNEMICLISGYRVDIRMRIIERWQELESGNNQHQSLSTLSVTTESYLAASKIMQATKEALKDFITDTNQLALSCSQVGFKATGVDIVKLSGVQLIAHEQKQLLTVSQVGQQLKPILTGRKVNLLLAEHGYQELAQDAKERNYWLITAQGEDFGVYQDTGKRHSDGAPVRQFKWYSSIIDELQGLQEVAA